MSAFDSFRRSAEFWSRAAIIYGSFKAAQARAGLLRATGADAGTVKAAVWDGQHAWAGEQMKQLCLDLRGFYLKVRAGTGTV